MVFQVRNVSPPPTVDGQLAEDVHGPLLDTVVSSEPHERIANLSHDQSRVVRT